MFLIGIRNVMFIVCFGFGMYVFSVFVSLIIFVFYCVLLFSVFSVEFWIIGRLLFGKLYLDSSL